MDQKTLVNAIKASSVHKKVGIYIREYINNIIKNDIESGLMLKDIAILIENKIKEEIKFDINNPLDKGIAFPTGLSVNNCAAHYTPNFREKDIKLCYDDIIKIDYGVHVNGTIIDSAFTLHFDPKYDEFINISRNLTKYAVSLCRPDAILGEIGRDIEEYIKSKEIVIDNKTYKLNIMRDLSGHMISKYEIHAGKAVPNIAINYPLRMKESEYYAIEPFITTGKGDSIVKEPTSHYMLVKNHEYIAKELRLTSIKKNLPINNLYKIINTNYSTLSFCQRWLYELDMVESNKTNKISMDYDKILKELENKKILNSYPPLYDINNSIISQFEHTIFVKENGIINLTHNEFY